MRNPRIRNRTIELIECEKLAGLYGRFNFDLSSRRYASAGRLIIEQPDNAYHQPARTKPIKNRRSRRVREVETQTDQSIKVWAQSRKLSRPSRSKTSLVLCHRCSRRTVGYSPGMVNHDANPVRRCQICRGKFKSSVNLPEGTDLALWSRRAEHRETSPASRRAKRVDSRPLKALSKDVRRKIWFTRCVVLPPPSGWTFGDITYHRFGSAREPSMRYQQDEGDFPITGYLMDTDRMFGGQKVKPGDHVYVPRGYSRESAQSQGILSISRSEAKLIGQSRIKSANVVPDKRTWRKGKRPGPSKAKRIKAWKYTCWRLKVARWEEVNSRRRELRATRDLRRRQRLYRNSRITVGRIEDLRARRTINPLTGRLMYPSDMTIDEIMAVFGSDPSYDPLDG
jgi:hypothetical protein